jgi:hypothetical protein
MLTRYPLLEPSNNAANRFLVTEREHDGQSRGPPPSNLWSFIYSETQAQQNHVHADGIKVIDSLSFIDQRNEQCSFLSQLALTGWYSTWHCLLGSSDIFTMIGRARVLNSRSPQPCHNQGVVLRTPYHYLPISARLSYRGCQSCNG